MSVRKYFLFRRSDPVGPVKRISENGKDIPIIAIPADKISFVSAGKGEINITFNDASVYEESQLYDGDSIEKTNITIACRQGEEMSMIEKILIFAGSTTGKPIMKFDVLKSSSPLKEAVLEQVSNMVTKVKSQPTERVSQKISTGDVATRYQNVVGEINFGSRENRPFVDFNHTSMYLVDNVSIGLAGAAKWFNEGTGGAAYNISAEGAGSVTTQLEATANDTGVGTACLQFASDAWLNMATDLTVKDDYTLYFVIGDPGSGSGGEGFGTLFGDDNAECTGFSTLNNPDVFSMRHTGLTGEPFKVRTSTSTSGTESYQFPDRSTETTVGKRQFCYPFVIRRDKLFNMYLYNFEGEVVAYVPAFTINSTKTPELKEIGRKYVERIERDALTDIAKKSPFTKARAIKVTEGTPGRTDGNLFIQQIGSSAGDVVNGFSKTLARFGVIKRDIGDANCSQLAQDLYELYKPTT